MHKLAMTVLLGIGLGIGCAQAQEIIKVRPPAVIVEQRGNAPGPGHVWIGGYHKWDGNAYAWVPGRWDLPPRPHAVWIGPRWVHRRRGWFFVEGRWR